MKKKIFAAVTAFLLTLTPLTAHAGSVIVVEPQVNLKDYTTSYDALHKANRMFSGNQALITYELRVMTEGCEIIPNTMEWEVYGTADVTFETDSFFKSVSYEENYANTYCLITANSPGSVHVVGTEYSLYDSDGTEFYFNFTVDADGNFEETFSMDDPLEPIISEESVYFPKPDTPCQFDLIVSSNLESAVTHDKDGCTFTPEEDGRYVVSTRSYCEEIVGCGTSDVPGHFHYFYPVLTNYTVSVIAGEITVTEKGSRSWYSEKQISKEVTAINEVLSSGDIQALACFDVYAAEPDDVMHGAYFSFINGYLPSVQGYYKSYITNVYTEYGTDSYFCVNHFYSDIVPVEPRVRALEKEIVNLTTQFTTASTCNGDLTACSPDMMQLTRIYADETLEGDLTVVVDGKEEYLLTVENGVFHNRKAASDLMGDCNNDGKLSVLDTIMLQKYLLCTGDLTIPQNADMCADGTIDAFDLAVMKKMLTAKNTENTPDNMPDVIDYHSEVTEADRENLWKMLSDQYPDMDFSDFTFVHDSDHPLSYHYNGKLFSIYYKNILLHGYGIFNCDASVFAVVGDTNAVNFVVDPTLFTQVDLEQEILSPLDVIPTCIDVETPELILYVDTIGENPPRLAYRAVEVGYDGEYILDAVTGESIEYIPYYVV